ncbi:hypothetical protein A6723_020500 [Pseudomonas sp. AU11447]|uniref:phospholipase D family protein n=1 Tax=unclassified Pseudomonas TaxID=196821 RepID=UPI0006D3BAF7|nr:MULTISPECIES: phospholipase D family protein [unclassified Pseudomonas]OBY90994.1 hypothetical protein A6723_020500 [Pseudomonas sp. AU11447]
MPNRASLDPEVRVLYGESLSAPSGYVFDAAVATTYSLDFETALAAPVSLALFAAENRDEILSQPLALLEGAERITDRLAVYYDAGHIQAQTQPQSRLCSLLEKMIIAVAAPQGGAFHPKIWVLRFKPQSGSGAAKMRLLVLSRNLTQDRSWDISLCLDGDVTRRVVPDNKPIVDLLKRLPRITVQPVSEDVRALTLDVAGDLNRAAWVLPEHFDTLSLAVNGIESEAWSPSACTRMGVISPFCDDTTLIQLARLSREKPVLVGRSDELAACSADTLALYERVSVLDDMAASEDGEEAAPESLQGLHAKAFIQEVGWDTVLTVGSGNATQAALANRKSANNVEVFATITGKSSKVGSVENILGAQGFGRLLCPFVASDVSADAAADKAAERRLEDVRRLICKAGLALCCERAPAEGEDAAGWRVWLICVQPLAVTSLASAFVWPITRGEGHHRDVLAALAAGEDVDLGVMPLADVTRFIAFQLADSDSDARLLFSIGLPMDGLPVERHSAIFRAIITNRDAFFRYLRLLLSELGDPFAAALAAQPGGSEGAWGRGRADEVPLLEDLVRALCAGDGRLSAVERLIRRLTAEDSTTDPVPTEFRVLWEAFRLAMPEEASHVH